MILFSIIIPTYERTNDLKKCLDCIENGKQFEMICLLRMQTMKS